MAPSFLADNDRLRQLVRIRQIYIPVLITRLHTVLYESRRKIPEYVQFLNTCPPNHDSYPCYSRSCRNLKQTLLLANIVADSRYKLYEDFVPENGRRLGDYLQLVKEATLGGLEGGGSDPFRVLYTL